MAPLRYAVSQAWIGRNPLTGVELPRDETHELVMPSLTYVQVEDLATKIWGLTNPEMDRALFHTLTYSGTRIGEATAARVGDLDVSNKRLKVARTWTVDRAGNRKIGPPKRWEQRWVPLPGFLVSELAELNSDVDAAEYLFRTKSGKAIDGSN